MFLRTHHCTLYIGTHLFIGIRLWITIGIGMHSSIRSLEMLKDVAKIMCL